MIFAKPNEVDLIWGAIAKAVANNDLGIAAKVAPDEGDPSKDRLICVYTKDFTDIEDITRVAKKLKDIGVWDPHAKKSYYYKCGKCAFEIGRLNVLTDGDQMRIRS